jgi:hypothetical protein
MISQYWTTTDEFLRNEPAPETAIMERRSMGPNFSGAIRPAGGDSATGRAPTLWRSIPLVVRALGLAATALVVVAIGLGGAAQPAPTVHHSAAVRFQNVNMRCNTEQQAQPCFVDRQTGQILQLEMPAGEVLDYAVCSPWRDERGQFQAVGRWMNRTGKQFGFLPREFGLARFSLPEGKVLDRIGLDHIPISEPCWIPGLAPRVLYPSGDGQIYRYDFSDSGSPASEARQPAQPQLVDWGVAPPGAGTVYVRDLIWPTEDALGGRLIAALCYVKNDRARPRMSGPELWWLQLSPDHSMIEAAGRLTDPGERDRPGGEDADLEERLPNVAVTAAGDLTLVYLSRPGLQQEWDLRAASIAIEPATGVPAIRGGSNHRVGSGFVCSSPTFSEDGRWIYGIRGHEPGGEQLTLRRIPVTTTLLAQSDAIPITSRPVRAPAQPGPLFGWANLVPFSPNRLVELARGRHAGK